MAKRKRRAVAYVRVSTASSAQLHSYEYQEQYWRGKFIDDPDIVLVGIYADRGISGSSIYKRPQFLIMMQDARDGKFDIIYTKSVSRFARNTVQLLEAVRELRDLGVEVIFEKEQISTMQPTSELFLTIAATVAENDLQVDSERQKWSIQHRYENGWISIGSGMFGYRMTKDNNLVIVEEEAAVIRRIYDMYISGMGCTTIARILNEEGSRTWCGNEWKPTRLLELMANEKYMGDSMMGKSVVVDGVQMDNMDGQHGKRYYMEDTHEGIVSKETWYKAQAIREQRRNDKVAGSKKPVYP
ncbi:MAG: recombinase family protein, partial [Oscillospiraceae bacterium]|nr:recombinase family protein [Oscillospiraceae bacterium]